MIHKLSKVELANVLTHAPGAIFGLVGLMYFESQQTHWSVLVFSLSFIGLFTASSIYHYKEEPEAKRKWRIVDHIGIYFLIAGTYTPFILTYLPTSKGFLILQVLWGCVLAGSILKIFFTGRFNVLSTIIYLLMGWMAVFAIKDFIAHIPMDILLLIGLGGICYTLGTIFYLWKKLTYHHAIWHVFVLGGAVSHWIAVFLSTHQQSPF